MSARKKIAGGTRAAVYRKDRHRCYYCGLTFPPEARPGLAPVLDDGTWLEIDHIVPLAAGGTNAIENLRSACTPCNKRKSAWVSESDWTARFLKARAAIGWEPSEHVAEKVISELLGRPFSMKEVQ